MRSMAGYGRRPRSDDRGGRFFPGVTWTRFSVPPFEARTHCSRYRTAADAAIHQVGDSLGRLGLAKMTPVPYLHIAVAVSGYFLTACPMRAVCGNEKPASPPNGAQFSIIVARILSCISWGKSLQLPQVQRPSMTGASVSQFQATS